MTCFYVTAQETYYVLTEPGNRNFAGGGGALWHPEQTEDREKPLPPFQ